MSYAELVCCSNFSFQYGSSHPFELVQRAKQLGYEALSVADECSLAGVVRAHEVAKEVGLKLIVGSQFRLDDGDRLVLLAPDHDAYSQTCSLITRMRCARKKGRYAVQRGDFAASADRCIGIWIPGQNIGEQQALWFGALRLSHKALGFAHHLDQDSDERQ